MLSVSAASSAGPSQIKLFLRADSPEGLVSLQLQVNLLAKGQANYTDFSNVSGKWYCWFQIDIDQYPEVVEFLNGNLSGSL